MVDEGITTFSTFDNETPEIPPDISGGDVIAPIGPIEEEEELVLYQSVWEGEQIDDAIGVILNGEIESAKNTAVQAAQQAETAKEESVNAAQSAAQSAQAAQTASVKTPYISNDGNWMVYNAETQKYVNSNVPATGPQGEQGEPGILVPVDSSAFSLRIDENGHLIATINYN